MNHLTSSVIHSVASGCPASNWVFSPASYLEAMYGLTLCAANQNRTELTQSLGLDETVSLEAQIAERKQGFTSLDTYNGLLFGSDYEGALDSTTINTLRNLNTDLRAFRSPDDAIALVNHIVEEKTCGKIHGLANRDNVNELTKLILLNCVHFKRDWLWEFDKPMYDETFHNADGSTTEVGYLKREEGYHYYEDPLFDLVRLPYQGSSVACYLFVPTQQGSVFSILDRFDAHFARVKDVASRWDCHLTVPPFKVESTHGLNDATRTAGVGSVFGWSKDWGVLDWTKLDPAAVVAVTAIVQKAYLDFNRTGTEAAAATGVMMCISGCCFGGEAPPIKVIRADHPFIFCLVDDNHKDTPLFVGAVNHV